MTLRKLAGSLVLGLVASLAAHTALFGGSHAMGGGYHGLLMQFSVSAGLAFVVLVAAFALTQAATFADGSIIAARLRERLPNFVGVLVCAISWYVAIESIEAEHVGAPTIIVVGMLLGAAFAVMRLARLVADAFAGIAFSIFKSTFSPHASAWYQRPNASSVAPQIFFARYLFARPPPIALAFSRA